MLQRNIKKIKDHFKALKHHNLHRKPLNTAQFTFLRSSSESAMKEATHQVYNLHDVPSKTLPHSQALTINDSPEPPLRADKVQSATETGINSGFMKYLVRLRVFFLYVYIGSSLNSTIPTTKSSFSPNAEKA